MSLGKINALQFREITLLENLLKKVFNIESCLPISKVDYPIFQLKITKSIQMHTPFYTSIFFDGKVKITKGVNSGQK